MTVPRLVLASSSEARLRVLHQAGIFPEVCVSGVDEDAGGLPTEEAVLVLAERKASAVAPRFGDSLVLGCDSLLDLDGVTFGKPGSATEAAQVWSRLSGRTATLHTGHCLVYGSDKRLSRLASTSVHFGTPTEEELAAYVSSGEPLSLAGAFSTDGLGAPFVEGIEGDASNVLGLSLPVFRKMLADLGVRIVDLWRRPVSPRLRRATQQDRQFIRDLIDREWGLPVVSVSGLYDPSTLTGIVAEQDGEVLGVLTYRVDESNLEVVTLNSVIEGCGIGSALLAEARRIAQAAQLRLWLITTNENLRAIGFYQRRGMEIAALHRNFVDETRRAKPDLGELPDARRSDPIAFRHAIEFEYPI
jgi:septum formation protein